MFKRILLAYDGTVEGVRALYEGALLAKSCGAEVFLLSVVPSTAGMLIAESVQCGAIATQNTAYRDLLDRAVARLQEFGMHPAARLAEGEPTPTIAQVAKEISADLVVVGHHTRGFLSRWWSGSRQDYLSDHLSCSVLVARNPISDEEFEAQMRKAGA
jgi:nucleotide-binding universal stress UspA family protein